MSTPMRNVLLCLALVASCRGEAPPLADAGDDNGAGKGGTDTGGNGGGGSGGTGTAGTGGAGVGGMGTGGGDGGTGGNGTGGRGGSGSAGTGGGGGMGGTGTGGRGGSGGTGGVGGGGTGGTGTGGRGGMGGSVGADAGAPDRPPVAMDGPPAPCARPIASDWIGDYDIKRLVIHYNFGPSPNYPLNHQTITYTRTPTKDQAGDTWALRSDFPASIKPGGVLDAYYGILKNGAPYDTQFATNTRWMKEGTNTLVADYEGDSVYRRKFAITVEGCVLKFVKIFPVEDFVNASGVMSSQISHEIVEGELVPAP